MLQSRMRGDPQEAFAPPIVESSVSPKPETCIGAVQGKPGGAEIFLVSERPNQLVLKVTSQAPGWLFIADSWYPGWTANVDSVSTPLNPANFLFRTVYLDQGIHNVSLDYHPFGFYFGGLFSILVLLLVIMRFALWGRLRK